MGSVIKSVLKLAQKTYVEIPKKSIMYVGYAMMCGETRLLSLCDFLEEL